MTKFKYDKPVGKEYVKFTEPTTIVILGDSPENYSTSSTPNSIQITDDETAFSLFIGDNKVHWQDIGSMGFADVFTLEEYNKYYEQNKEMLSDYEGLVGGVVIQNFVGKIEVTAFRQERSGKTKFSNEFDMSDYIQHQFENDFCEVGIILPEETQIIDLNLDCSLPKYILRDIKIDSIL